MNSHARIQLLIFSFLIFSLQVCSQEKADSATVNYSLGEVVVNAKKWCIHLILKYIGLMMPCGNVIAMY